MNVDVEPNVSSEMGDYSEDAHYQAELTLKIEPILNEMLIKIEADINRFANSLPTDPIYFPVSTACTRFSSVNTCDSCATQDSVFWRRVARAKIVCNKCFFSQTYLLLFRETKENLEASPLQSMDQDEQEQPVRKKTRASLKNIANTNNSEKSSPATGHLFNCFTDNTVDMKNPASSASSTTSSCSNKTGPSNEIKMELDLDDQMFHMPRKSTRFTSNKSKKNENKSSGKNKKSPKSEETPNSDKASPILSPDLFAKSTDSTKVTTPSLKSRRTKLFKSEKAPPVKSQVLMSTIFTSEFVFHRGFYMQVGDIVALYDETDPQENVPYFAQIRAFLTDQYGEKSAVLTWLVPIDSNYANAIRTPKDFNPDLFISGPAEEYPRPLNCLEFVCRLVDYSNNKLRASEYIHTSYQFKNDLQRHKFMLSDLADSNLRLMSTKYPTESNQMEYEIKWGYQNN